MAGEVLIRAVLVGGTVSLLCAPYVYVQTQPATLAWLRVAFLVPVCVLLVQAGLAWTPLAGGQAALTAWPLPWRRTAWFLVAAAALGGVRLAVLDARLESLHSGYLPGSLGDWSLGLPWVVLFQPLVMVVGVYAFAYRLSGRQAVGVAAVTVASQVLVLTRYGGLVPLAQVGLMAGAGAYALFLATAYLGVGGIGLALVVLVMHLRLLVRLLAA